MALIIATLEFDAKELIGILAWNRRRDEEEREQQLQKAEHERRKSEELSKFKQLLNRSERAFQADRIRNYIVKIETNAIAEDILTDELAGWLMWARAKAHWYDPLVNSQDKLLRIASKFNIK